MDSFLQWLLFYVNLWIVNISLIAMFLEFFMGIQHPQVLSQYFFSYFSTILFQIFQTDKPMIPFVSDELQKIYSKLLNVIVQKGL